MSRFCGAKILGGRGRRNRGGEDPFADDAGGKSSSSSSGGGDGASDGPRGRRERGGLRDSESKLAGAFGDDDDRSGGRQQDSQASAGEKSPGAPPKPSSGWGDTPSEGKTSGGRSSRGRRDRSARNDSSNQESSSSSSSSGRRKGRNYFDDDGSDDEIPTIPDLEEEEEEMTLLEVQIANAPKNVDRRTVNLRDLTSEVKHLLPEQGKGVDLSLLTATLCPQEICVEQDVEWRFDSLFEQTCQDIHAEEEATEEAARAERKKARSWWQWRSGWLRPPGEMHRTKEEALGLLAGGGAAAGLERRARRATVRPEARARVWWGKTQVGGWGRGMLLPSQNMRATRDRVL